MDSMGTTSRPAPAGSKLDRWWWLALPVAAVALMAYAPALDGGFTDIDDEEMFVRNNQFRGLGGPEVGWAFANRVAGVYQPVAWLIYELEYVRFGLEPRGFHLTSLALHAATAIALFFLIRSLLMRATPDDDPASRRGTAIASALVASAFAAHPLRASVVAWAANQGYLPCALFAVLSVLAYLRAAGAARWASYLAWLAASVALYAGSLGAHAVPMGLPAVLLVLDIYPLRRPDGRWRRWAGLALEKLPFAALGVAAAAAAVWARGGGEGVATLATVGIVERLVHACYSMGFYVAKSVAPTALRAIYPMPAHIDWTEPRFALAIVGVVGFVVVAAVFRRRLPWLAAAGLCYGLILLPNSGLVRNVSVIAADHYSYLATIPLAVAAAGGLAAISRRPRAILATVPVCGAVIVALAVSAREQARTWHDAVSVWTRVVAANPEPDVYFQSRLGRALLDAGRLDEARAALVRAVEIDPTFPIARNKLGLVLVAQGQHAEAAAQFAEAVRVAPSYVEARINNGYILAQFGRLAAAADEFAAAAELQPGLIEAQSNLGAARAQQGRFAEAAAAFERELALDPARPEARKNLGYALINLKRFGDAAAQYAEALRLRPDDAGAHHNLAHCLSRLGRLDEAATHYSEALRLDPSMVESRRGLDELLQARLGRGTLRR
jgi:tetratricopeptide (TPR) repeat protein